MLFAAQEALYWLSFSLLHYDAK